MLKIREEEEKKREVATKFQSTLTELGNLLAQNNDKNAKLRDDNLDMTTKLKNVCEQYERKEQVSELWIISLILSQIAVRVANILTFYQHVEKLAKQMHLEIQLADAKFAKAKMEMAMEKETLLREKQQLLIVSIVYVLAIFVGEGLAFYEKSRTLPPPSSFGWTALENRNINLDQ